MKILPFVLLSLAVSLAEASAGCTSGESHTALFSRAVHVVEARVISAGSMLSGTGGVITRHDLSITTRFKGTAPALITVESPGGEIGGVLSVSSGSLDLEPGRSYVVYLSGTAGGTWKADPFSIIPIPRDEGKAGAIRGFFREGAVDENFVIPKDVRRGGGRGAKDIIPGSRITPTGYFERFGIPRRFTEGDEGREIPYLIDLDATKLPAGISQQTAITIVGNAFNAWAAASSVRFRYAGLFTATNSADIAAPDGTILVQLHDTFGAVTGNALGMGGGDINFTNTPGVSMGGHVAGQEFHKLVRGYIIMNHLRTVFDSNPTLYAETLTHEVGHVLGLEHSSLDPAEPEPLLKTATMYFSVNDDGRGAAIRPYDTNRIQFGYPPANTPPFAMERIIRVVTGSPQPTGPGIDRVTVTPRDLQTSSGLTIELIPDAQTGAAGSWSLSGGTVVFTPSGNFADAVLTPSQIAAGSGYDGIYYRCGDGVNFSPAYHIRVVGFENDSQPSDGLPDTWLNTYFGVISPGAAGTPRHPDSDPDGDGLSNRIERFLGTNPLDPKSGPPKLAYNAQTGLLTLTPSRFAPHVIESSTNLSAWSFLGLHSTWIAATPPDFVIHGKGAPAASKFYRVRVTP